MSESRFGFDGEEGMIFDRTKPCTQGEDTEGLYEEVTLPELIAHANKLEAERDPYRNLLDIETRDSQIKELQSRLEESLKRADEWSAQLTVVAAERDGYKSAADLWRSSCQDEIRLRKEAVSRLSSFANQLNRTFGQISGDYCFVCGADAGGDCKPSCFVPMARELIKDFVVEKPLPNGG